MGVHSKDVFVGAPDQTKVTGAILTGPETDEIPDSIDDFNVAGLEDSGYVGEDGVTIAPSESTESIRDWSLKVIRKILTEFDATIAWSHIALDEFSLKNYMGDDNVQVTAATATTGTQIRAAIAGEARPVKAWYFRIKDGARRALVMVPHGQVTERGEIAFIASGPITLPVTLSTYPDADGKSIYIFLDDGTFASA